MAVLLCIYENSESGRCMVHEESQRRPEGEGPGEQGWKRPGDNFAFVTDLYPAKKKTPSRKNAIEVPVRKGKEAKIGMKRSARNWLRAKLEENFSSSITRSSGRREGPE